MKLHIATRSKIAETQFCEANPNISQRVVFHSKSTSLFDAINRIIYNFDDDIAIFAHDDVYFPNTLISSIEELLTFLGQEWPNWGIIGNAGVATYGFGVNGKQIVRYLSDSRGGPNAQGHIIPCQSVYGNVMMLNCRALREKAIRLPHWNGYQLYDVVLSLQALSQGLAVLVAPHLACFHDSAGNRDAFEQAASSQDFAAYLGDTVANVKFTTWNGIVEAPYCFPPNGFDVELTALRRASECRQKSTLAIIIRSELHNRFLLERTISTAMAFRAEAHEILNIEIATISDAKSEGWDHCEGLVQFIEMPLESIQSEAGETRSVLVSYAISKVDADFYWFIDEGDWIFPNEAERIGLTLRVSPDSSIMFLDTMRFGEAFGVEIDSCHSDYAIEPSARVRARDWTLAFGGQSSIPLSGMILSHKVANSIPRAILDRVAHMENATLLLASLFECAAFPIVVDKLAVGISVRKPLKSIPRSHGVLAIDRTIVNRSAAELASFMTSRPSVAPLYYYVSGAPAAGAAPYRDRFEATREEIRLINLKRSISGAVSLVSNPRRWKRRLRELRLAYGRAGIKGVRRGLRKFGLE